MCRAVLLVWVVLGLGACGGGGLPVGTDATDAAAPPVVADAAVTSDGVAGSPSRADIGGCWSSANDEEIDLLTDGGFVHVRGRERSEGTRTFLRTGCSTDAPSPPSPACSPLTPGAPLADGDGGTVVNARCDRICAAPGVRPFCITPTGETTWCAGCAR